VQKVSPTLDPTGAVLVGHDGSDPSGTAVRSDFEDAVLQSLRRDIASLKLPGGTEACCSGPPPPSWSDTPSAPWWWCRSPVRTNPPTSRLGWAGPDEPSYARSRKRSKTRAPNRRASVGTRSSTPWKSAVKSRLAGSLNGANPKHRIPSLCQCLASVPPDIR
jgi:hypothetical protein